MSTPYLSKDGLLYLWAKVKSFVTAAISNKVDAVEGKGLSTNDFTDEYKAKLDEAKTSVAWSDITDKPDVALKSDVSSIYQWKGSVENKSDLPSNAEVGWVYDVKSMGGMNYGWTGEDWDALGQTFHIDSITNEEIDEIIAGS